MNNLLHELIKNHPLYSIKFSDLLPDLYGSEDWENASSDFEFLGAMNNTFFWSLINKGFLENEAYHIVLKENKL